MRNENGIPETNNAITSAYEAVADAACARLAKNQRVRRNLPDGGRLRMDRQLPFLCIHRNPSKQPDNATRQLITTEAAYLFASGDPSHNEGLSHLIHTICCAMEEHFGTFLLIEILADGGLSQNFQIGASEVDSIPSSIDTLETELSSIRINGRPASVIRCETRQELQAFPSESLASTASFSISLKIKPCYRDAGTGSVYPLVLQRLRGQLAVAIRKTVAQFTGSKGESEQTHYQSFGPTAMVKAASLIDQQLCDVAHSFDFILQVTPTNAEEAWTHFQESGYEELPTLHYRHLPYHPNLLKRRLFAIEIERVEDPTLAHLFWEKQDEVDRQLTSLRDLHLPDVTVATTSQQSNFLSSSLQLYGEPEESLYALANEILKRFPPDEKRSHVNHRVNSQEFLARAREETNYYHARLNEFNAKVELSDSIASGIMVSQDRLLVAYDISLPEQRVEPLLHHEIGTHLLTYFNGRCQPLRQLYAGFAGYEELQEGLAVFAEYLVGGLTRKRIRTLAARVVAIRWMVDGNSFASVYRHLREQHRFSKRQSFTTTLRVFRGGGLTKDLIYLRGLRDLMEHLATGHDLEPLYVGKIGLQHVPYVQELRRRGIITPPKLLPRFWEDKSIHERLAAVRGKSVLDLIE